MKTHKSASICLIPSALVASQFGNMEGITTAVLDEFPQLRMNTLHKSLFLGALCFFFYLMGLLLVTDVSVFDGLRRVGKAAAKCNFSVITWLTLLSVSS